MKELIIDDMTGGLRDERHMILAPNECARLSGFDHRFGGLRVQKSHQEIPLSEIPEDNGKHGTTRKWTNIGEYLTPSGDQILLGKRNGDVWFGVKDCCDRLPLVNYAFECTMEGLTLKDRHGVPSTITEHGTSRINSWRGDTRLFAGHDYIETDFTPTDWGAGPPEVYTGFTFSFWFKPRTEMLDELSSFGYIATTLRNGTTGNGLLLYIYNGALFLYVYNGTDYCYIGTTLAGVIDPDTWHHVAVAYDYVTTGSKQGAIYLDGVAVANVVTGDDVKSIHDDPLLIGTNITTSSGELFYPWLGEMGCFTFYSTALSGAQVLAQYEHEASRYDATAVQLPITWRPLLTRALDAGLVFDADHYLRPRGIPDGSEKFFQIGTSLFFGPDRATTGDKLMRWDSGYWMSIGKVCTDYGGSGTDVVKFYYYGVNPVLAGMNVQAGDVIYFRTWHADTSTWEWDLNSGRVIEDVDQAARTFTLRTGFTTASQGDSASTEGADYVEYVIVRVHPHGVPKATAASAAASGGGSWTLPSATYNWKWCYANSVTGDLGTVSPAASLARAPAQQIPRISGWSATPEHLDVDEVRIYREEGGLYYLVNKLTRTLYTYPAFALYWDDDNTVIDTTDTVNHAELEADAAYRDPPPALSAPLYMNDRIWGADVDDPNVLWMSTLGQTGAFPPNDIRDDVGSLTDLGGPWQVGDGSSDRIIGILPDVGAFSTTGVQGGSVIVYMAHNAKRLYGMDRTDFQLMPAFEVGAVSRKLMMNAAGTLVWMTPAGHLMACAVGTNYPQIISKRLWENGLDVTPETMEKWSLAYWDDQILLCGPEDDGTNARFYALALDGSTWNSGSLGLTDLLPTKDSRIYTLIGSGFDEIEADGQYYGPVWGLFGDTAIQAVEYVGGKLPLEGSAAEMAKHKHFGYVTMCWRGADDITTGTLSLYEAGDLSAAIVAESFEVPADSSKRNIVQVHLKGNAIMPQLGISGQAAHPAQLEWMHIDGDVHR